MIALLRIGTRGSPLALAQARETRRRLAAAWPELAAPDAIVITEIRTSGDRIQDRTLMQSGGKGLFTKEIEDALLAGSIDLAVHSMKDVPTAMPDGLDLAAILPREDVRDAWFSRSGAGLLDLPAGSVVGTASLRRQAQILSHRPDLQVVPFRGNVETRLAKLQSGVVDATLLAMAGLNRLGLSSRITAVIEPEIMLPAVAQGAVGLQIRTDDTATRSRLAALNCRDSALRVTAERALLAALDGSCRTPIAALATLRPDGQLDLRAQVLRPDGAVQFSASRLGPASDAARLGRDAGEELKYRLPDDFFRVEMSATADGKDVR
jgi:hydroxymethylbilane synthase